MDAEQFVGPLIFWSFYISKHGWTGERGAYVISILRFIWIQNCYEDNQHPSLPLRNPDRHTHIHTANLSPSKLVTNCIFLRYWQGGRSQFGLFDPFPPIPPSLALKTNVQASLPPPLFSLRSSSLLPLSVILHLLHFAVTVGYHRGAVGDWFASFEWGRFASVSVVVEVGKEDDEGDSIANQGPLHPVGEWTSGVEGVAGMANGHVELDLWSKNKVLYSKAKPKKASNTKSLGYRVKHTMWDMNILLWLTESSSELVYSITDIWTAIGTNRYHKQPTFSSKVYTS